MREGNAGRNLVRAFEIVHVPLEGRPGTRSANRITCGCGTQAISGGNKLVPPEAAIRHFKREGWHVGNKPKHDICPACVAKTTRRAAPKMTLVTPTTEPTDMGHIDGKNLAVILSPELKAEPPRVMAIDDRRIVFEKIGDVYDPKIGYSKGWTDQRIAVELGCPRAWVSEVREQFYGPEANQELVTLRGAHKRITDKMAELAVDAKNLSVTAADVAREQATLQGEFSRLSGALVSLGQRLAKLEG